MNGGEPRLLLPADLAGRIARQAEAAYPREGCGVLLGEVDGALRSVTSLEAAKNRWPDRPDRYRIDPETLRRLLDEEDRGGPRVLGFYHSHPDAEPVPSETDRKLAWPWYLYLIVPVRDGVAGTARAWQLASPDAPLEERSVRVDGPPAAASPRGDRTP